MIRFDNRDAGHSTHFHECGVQPLWSVLGRVLLGLPVPAPYTLEDMAQDVLGLLDALGLPEAHVVGISMGGMIAQTVALLAPHRVLSLTSLMSAPSWVFPCKARAMGALMKPTRPSREAMIERSVEFARALTGTRFPFEETPIRETSELAYERGSRPEALRPAGAGHSRLAVSGQETS